MQSNSSKNVARAEQFPPRPGAAFGGAAIWARPWVGQALLIAAGLAYYFLAMIVSLVGRAGQATPHAAQNRAAFGAVLLLALALNWAAWRAKLRRRRQDGSPYPYGAAALLLLGLAILVAFLTGSLAH